MSCKKQTSWDVDASLPLVRSHLNISNFFGDTIFKSDPSGLVHIAFSKEIVNYTMDSLVSLPDTTLKLGFVSFFSNTFQPNAFIFSNSSSASDKEVTFDINDDVQLHKAIIKKGMIKMVYKNTYSQPLNFNYYINSASLYGSPFHVNQTINGGSVISPGVLTKYYSLAGYDINMRGLNFNKSNTLVETYTLTTDASGQAATLNAGEGLSIELSFTDVVPEYVQGYFGQQTITLGPDSSLLGFFSNFIPNNLVLTQSSINFRIINEFGVDISSVINSVKSIKTAPGQSILLNSGNLLSAINVNRAGKTNTLPDPVFPWIKQININSSNSNLNAFLQNVPNYLGYSVTTKLNPLGNVSGSNDFAYYGHGLKVIADIDIPMALSANYFKLISLSKVDLTKLDQIKNVNSCDIHLQAKNNYPFKALLQGYMIDEFGRTIDSLFTSGQNTIQAAITDVNNTVLNAVDTKITVTLNKTKTENLTKCKQIQFVSYFYLSNQPTPIKITTDSYLDLIISADVNYNVKVK